MSVIIYATIPLKPCKWKRSTMPLNCPHFVDISVPSRNLAKSTLTYLEEFVQSVVTTVNGYSAASMVEFGNSCNF